MAIQSIHIQFTFSIEYQNRHDGLLLMRGRPGILTVYFIEIRHFSLFFFPSFFFLSFFSQLHSHPLLFPQSLPPSHPFLHLHSSFSALSSLPKNLTCNVMCVGRKGGANSDKMHAGAMCKST